MWKKTIRILDKLTDLVIVCFFLPILCFGIYGLWDSQHISAAADAKVYETYRPGKDADSFAALKQKNPEVFGWLTVEGTHIDYPLVQGDNNSKYVNTDVSGSFSLSGSLFLDCRNDASFQDLNNVIYGHHMEKDAMFGELEQFADKAYMDAHPTGSLYYDGTWHTVEWFAFTRADAYDEVLYNVLLAQNEQPVYLQSLQTKASQYKDIDIRPEDRFVALSTCTDTSTNGRHLLVGKLKEGGKQ